MGYSGAGGKLIHKKTRSKKSRDTVPLKRQIAHSEYTYIEYYCLRKVDVGRCYTIAYPAAANFFLSKYYLSLYVAESPCTNTNRDLSYQLCTEDWTAELENNRTMKEVAD